MREGMDRRRRWRYYVTGYSSGAAWVTADDDNEDNILLTRVQLDP